jgi:hypothetical protein
MLSIQIPRETIEQKLYRQKTHNPIVHQEPEEIFEQEYRTVAQKRLQITALMIRSASIGDLATITECLENYGEFVDINAVDDAGSSALVYACCMGYSDIVSLLFEKGATMSLKEKKYISLLALSNGHFEIATILDFHDGVDEDEEVQVDVQLESMDQIVQEFIEVDLYDHESFSKGERMDVKMEPTVTEILENATDEIYRQMDHVLTIAVQRIVPLRKDFVPLGANVIWIHALKLEKKNVQLSKEFLERAIGVISDWVALSLHSYTLCYWISNCLQLLIYLKKDALFLNTFDIQFQLTDLINDISKKFQDTFTSKLNEGLSTFINHEKDTVADIKYIDDYFSFRTPRVVEELFFGSQVVCTSPHDVIQILDGFLNICKTGGLHLTITIQLFSRICRYINSCLFAAVMQDHELCCRARARLLQENLSEIIGWVREKEMSLQKTSMIIKEFLPIVQLLQFIQVIMF